jgi:hypothetical protein
MHSKQATLVERMGAEEVVKATQNMADYKTRFAPDLSDAFSMQGGNISDILSAKDGKIYLRHAELGNDLSKSDKWSFHLYSTSRFVDDNEAHRSHFFFGKGDHSLMDYGIGPRKKAKSSDSEEPSAGMVPCRDLGAELPFHARALAKAGDAIIVGGYPHSEEKTFLYNKPVGEKGVLQVMSSSTGEVLHTEELETPPRFDGISVAGGAIFVACEDGSVVCFK